MNKRYVIGDKIGQGGLGEVYRSFDSRMNREVAVKRISIQESDTELREESTRQLIQEAGALASLQHPHIVTVYDVDSDEEGPYVVMELISGKTLDELIDHAPLTWPDFRELALQTEEALIAAHELNLIHSDIKPSNLMLTWLPSGKFQVKIVDFGLATLLHAQPKEDLDEAESVYGSIFFMAPEQFERVPIDFRTDLYAMGCVYYQALTGSYPFNGETGKDVMISHLHHHVIPIQEIRDDIPLWACDWIMWHLNRQPTDRPESAREALHLFLQNDKTPNPPLSQGKTPAAAAAPRSRPMAPMPRRVGAAAPQATQPPATTAEAPRKVIVPQALLPPEGSKPSIYNAPTPAKKTAAIATPQEIAKPQAAMPQAIKPRAAAPQAATPQAATPQAATPQAATPQAAIPRAAMPRATMPRAPMRQATKPQVAETQVAEPQIAEPQIAEPQIATPQIATPQIATPQIATPQIATPQIAEPQVATPRAAMPRATMPQAAMPQAIKPQIATPRAAAPEPVVPQTDELQTDELQTDELQTDELQTDELQTEEPQTEESQVVEPQVATPRAAMPRAAMPRATMPRAAMPQAIKPQVATPRATAPEPVVPQTEEPQTEEPQTEEPQIEEPQIVEPQIVEPQIVEPQVVEPQVGKPQTAKPQTAKPQTGIPQTAKPQGAKPVVVPKTIKPKGSLQLTHRLKLIIAASVAGCLLVGGGSFALYKYSKANESAKRHQKILEAVANTGTHEIPMSATEFAAFIDEVITADTDEKREAVFRALALAKPNDGSDFETKITEFATQSTRILPELREAIFRAVIAKRATPAMVPALTEFARTSNDANSAAAAMRATRGAAGDGQFETFLAVIQYHPNAELRKAAVESAEGILSRSKQRPAFAKLIASALSSTANQKIRESLARLQTAASQP